MSGVLTLSDVLARRGVLAPAEVVTLVVPLALDLAGLHDAGQVHGGVCADAVGFAADGRPLLRAGTPDAAAATPADDVFALATLGSSALCGQPAPALAVALQAGLADDPARRCNARELAERVLASGPAAPLRLPLPQDHRELSTLERAKSTTSRWRASILVAAVLIALVPRGFSAGPRWAYVLTQFDRARLAAFTALDPSRLHEVYADGSAQLARDTAMIGDLAREGLAVRGRLAELTQPTVVGAVTLSAVERPASYVLVDRHGRVVLRVDGGKPRRVVVRLRHTTNGWRVANVSG